ncbi:unnamed protein product [Adineta steineri]|uniref:Uncharacterized protein n=1 Tax=Adineta steineri TaxID=433720 RepID=A0A818LE06_9BILA|nr:unnamed protein product [Adineta steineri]
MEALTIKQQNEIYPLVNMFEETSEQFDPNVDYDCLRKYDENNTHFSMAIIVENRDDEQEHVIGYNCIYHYDTHRVKLEYDIAIGCWKIFPEELSNILFNDIQTLKLNEQIELIIKRLDQQFFDLEQHLYQNKLPSISKEEHIELSSLTIPEDVVDYGLHSFISGSRSKFSGLAPPPVAPRRSRQNSACSTQSSVRYASFVPPPTAPVRRRRVIESILLHVQRKKKTFEKIVDVIKGRDAVKMHDLGIEFLRVYDGRFNYREGHEFVMSYRKKTWSLTIDKITCVDCPVGDIGPRSVLILNYKGQYTSVHV